ncbi:MAG TPA: ATP-binding cassette domain-containing protein [Beutenbergiaceae bacterium]|nr:ATP-binding cassette domain-containing protein [Beutenbergiaceae bacterium]
MSKDLGNDPRPLLQVQDLVKHFKAPRSRRRDGQSVVHAVCGVSFEVPKAKTFGIVGESGSGKTTVLRTVLGLHPATAGRVVFDSATVGEMAREELAEFRRRVAVVFQDPYTSLDPRMTVHQLLAEPAKIQRTGHDERRTRELLDLVRLPSDAAERYPHEFSGGQRQRIAIARALALEPDLVVLDEPVSALDVTVQAEILTLLQSLQQDRGVSYLLVTHDLAVVADLAHHIGVMQLGRMVEQGPTGDVIGRPQDPYTQALLAAVPVPDPAIERAKPPPRPGVAADRVSGAECPHGERV